MNVWQSPKYASVFEKDLDVFSSMMREYFALSSLQAIDIDYLMQISM